MFFMVLFLVNDNNPGSGDIPEIRRSVTAACGKVSCLSGQYSGIRSVFQDMLLDMCEKSQAAGWMAFFKYKFVFL